MIFHDQVNNVFTAGPVEGHIIVSSVLLGNNTRTLSRRVVLAQNYPNPFNPITSISFQLPKSSHVSIKIINLLGQEIRSVYTGIKPAGSHTVLWDSKDTNGINVPSGIYFCILSVNRGETIKTTKMLLIR